MKKVTTICIAALALAGCGASTTGSSYQAPETTQYVPQTTQTTYGDDDLFVAAVSSEYPAVMGQLGGRSQLIRLGNLICQAIDEGSTLADFAMLAVDNDVDPEMLGFIMGVAISIYCPNNEWFLSSAGV